MQEDIEYIALSVGAVLLIGAILVAIADTPAYPLAFGIEIVALIYVLVLPSGPKLLGPAMDTLLKFVGGPQ